MTTARLRVLIFAILFFGWISWLGVMAWRSTGMVVVSRAQILTADAVVIAKVEADAGKPYSEVTIKEVLDSTGKRQIHLEVPETIKGLHELNKENGWKGEGDYVVPLVYTGQSFEVHAIPKSPGARPDPRMRIYQVDRQVLAQVQSYLAAKKN